MYQHEDQVRHDWKANDIQRLHRPNQDEPAQQTGRHVVGVMSRDRALGFERCIEQGGGVERISEQRVDRSRTGHGRSGAAP
jgi:hypothetical protein